MLIKIIALHTDKVETISLVCIYRHTIFVQNQYQSFYIRLKSFNFEDSDENYIPGLWRTEINDVYLLLHLQNAPRRTTNEAQGIPNEYLYYFLSSEGEIS